MNRLTGEVFVWCHICGSQQIAKISDQSNELECQACQSNFVEELNQGIEEFLQPEANEQPHQSINNGGDDQHIDTESEEEEEHNRRSQNENEGDNDNDDDDASSQILRAVLGRILGITSDLTSTSTPTTDDDEPGIAIIHQTNGVTRRPIGVLIRQGSYSSSSNSNNNNNLILRRERGVENESQSATIRRSNLTTDHGLPAGLLALLNSVSNIRHAGIHHSYQHHPYSHPDALSNAQFEQFLHHILMNESSHAGAPPASETILQSLIKQTITETTDLSTLGECCISQETFEIGDVVVCLPCGHNYKEDPIIHWLKMHNTCPVCRIEVNSSMSSKSETFDT